MYLSADRLALANQKALETFEQCSIAWQAVPHWNTGDPGQTQVRSDVLNRPTFLDLELKREEFQLTLAQTGAPTPDSLLAEVFASSARLAKTVDKIVLQKLYDDANANKVIDLDVPPPKVDDTLKALIEARASVEDDGYRAPSCIITNTEGLVVLSALAGGYPATEGLLTAANANALHRATNINAASTALAILVLGRRQLIPYGCAAEAAAGQEPVDLAVSVLPSVEVVGETGAGKIQLAVRIRFAVRVKDPKAVVVIYDKPEPTKAEAEKAAAAAPATPAEDEDEDEDKF
jgi:hypothetical protein